MAGFARFVALNAPAVWFDVIYWGTGTMLFACPASRFLLRPEVPLFADLDRCWNRVVRTALNHTLCMLTFVIVVWMASHLVEGVDRYGLAPAAGPAAIAS